MAPTTDTLYHYQCSNTHCTVELWHVSESQAIRLAETVAKENAQPSLHFTVKKLQSKAKYGSPYVVSAQFHLEVAEASRLSTLENYFSHSNPLRNLLHHED